MPNVDITCLDGDQKSGWEKDSKQLGKAIAEVFCRHAGCQLTDVHTRFHPVKPAEYVIGDKTLEHAQNDPKGLWGQRIFEINVKWYDRPGRLDATQEAVAADLVTVVSQTIRLAPEKIEVNFDFLKRENHYEGGKRAPAP